MQIAEEDSCSTKSSVFFAELSPLYTISSSNTRTIPDIVYYRLQLSVLSMLLLEICLTFIIVIIKIIN